MSTRTRPVTELVCDGCGAVLEFEGSDATTVRIAAAAKGWTYKAWTGPGMRAKGQRTPRNSDTCPACPIPDAPP